MRNLVLLTLVALSSATCGYSQGFYWNTASARSTAMGGVYIPSATGPLDSLAANPAGLTVLNGPVADLSVTGAFARGSFTNSVNNASPMTTAPGMVPFGAFGMPIGKSRFSFAIGEMPELLSVSNWHYTDAPGVAGATYGMQQQKSAILATRTAAGLGIYLGPRVSVGVSVGADYNSNTLNAPYIFQEQPVLKGLKTLLDLKTTGFGWNYSVGTLVHATRKVQVSAAWKSRTVIESTGNASGNLAQQAAAIGLGGINPNFNYDARVKNILPQSVLVGATWRMNSRWTFALQGDYVGWKNSFKQLPVYLTNGNNSAINGLVNSTGLNDYVPLQWKNQYSIHAGFERLITESVSVSGGYAHANNPVPGSTLTPLTAAILANQFSTGVGYTRGRARFDLAYAFDPTAKSSVGQSALLSGEYSNSSVKVGVQFLTLSSSFRF